MMLMRMKPDKSQVTSYYKWSVNGSFSFTQRDLLIMHGYTSYMAMIIGAAGGRSGRAGGVISGRTVYVYGAGGGGGQSKLVSGLLKDLPVSTTAVVGLTGTTGANNAANTSGALAGAGGKGGDSSWNGITSEGGYGGQGGNVYSTNPDFQEESVGGRGGGTTAGATGDGAWDDTTKIGKGGQGGKGDIYDSAWGGSQGLGRAGSYGAALPPNTYRGTGEAIQATYEGGKGGGANIAAVSGGADEYYGQGNGAVVIKAS